MRCLIAVSLLAFGCASAPPPEPKIVERVVYVEAPCRAPVMVETNGHGDPWLRKKKAHKHGHAEWARRHGKHDDVSLR